MGCSSYGWFIAYVSRLQLEIDIINCKVISEIIFSIKIRPKSHFLQKLIPCTPIHNAVVSSDRHLSLMSRKLCF